MVWIPFVNYLILFVWLFNCYHMEEGPKIFRKSFLIIFGTVLPMAFLQILLSKIFADGSAMQAVINALFIYLIPWVLGFALIKYQRKVLKLDETATAEKSPDPGDASVR